MVGLLVDMSFWSEVPVMTCPFTASALEAGTEIYKEPFMISIFRVKQLPSKRKKAPAPIKRMIDTGASVIFKQMLLFLLRTQKSPGASLKILRGRGGGKVDVDWSLLQNIHARM